MAKSTKLDEIQLQVIINGDRAGKTLGDLKQAQKQLNAEINQTTVGSEAYIKKMDELKKVNTQLEKTKKEIRGVKDEMNNGKNTAMELAGAFGIAFGVQQVISFGKESIKAFMEAEENAHQLAFAVKNIGNEGEEAFTKLIELSEELEGNSIFSDDEIQRAETMLANYGLTSDEIVKLTPKIVNLATVQRVSLADATDTAIKAIEGQTKGLKTAGVAFTDTGSKVENFNTLLQKLDKFAGASEESITTWEGHLKQSSNTINNLMENVGEFILVTVAGLIDGIKALGSVFTGELFSVEEKVRTLAEQMENVLASTNKMAKEADLSTLEKNISGATTELELYNKELEKATKAGNQKMINDVKQVIEVTEKQKMIYQGYYDNLSLQEKAKAGLTKLTLDELEQLNSIAAKDEIKRRKEVAEASKKIGEQSKKDYEKLKEDIEKIEQDADLNSLKGRDKALKAIDVKYKAFIDKAKGHAKELVRLKVAQEKEEATANKEFDEKEKEAHEKSLNELLELSGKLGDEAQKQLDDDNKKKLEGYQKDQEAHKQALEAKLATAQAVHAGLMALADLAGQQGSDTAVFMKALALFQIGINTATSISAGIAGATTAATATGPGAFVATPLFIATTIATILGAMAQANKVLQEAPAPKPFAAGGPSFAPGGHVNKPFMALAGEAGPEWIAPNWMLRNPRTANIIGALENIRQSRAFAAGGSTESPVNNINVGAPVIPSNEALIMAVTRLNTILSTGIMAKLSYDQFVKDLAYINAAKTRAVIS